MRTDGKREISRQMRKLGVAPSTIAMNLGVSTRTVYRCSVRTMSADRWNAYITCWDRKFPWTYYIFLCISVWYGTRGIRIRRICGEGMQPSTWWTLSSVNCVATADQRAFAEQPIQKMKHQVACDRVWIVVEENNHPVKIRMVLEIFFSAQIMQVS